MAFVTVVIPVWDSYCDHLAESVWSALRQADVDARVIVVDNASERTVPDLGSEVRIVRSDVRLGVARLATWAWLQSRPATSRSSTPTTSCCPARSPSSCGSWRQTRAA